MNQGPPAANRLLHFRFALFTDHEGIDQPVDFALDCLVRDRNFLWHRVSQFPQCFIFVQSSHQTETPVLAGVRAIRLGERTMNGIKRVWDMNSGSRRATWKLRSEGG